jgi:hypothetical protein
MPRPLLPRAHTRRASLGPNAAAALLHTLGRHVFLQILHRTRDDVCLLLFGTSGTRNRENDASAAEPGGEDDYAHITEAHE